jgi:pyridoxine 5-phosphate synthase
MTHLSVNINKIATIRNARGGNIPNLLDAAKRCQDFGADGITVHPRPDQRHITKKDAYALRSVVNKEYNIEGYPSQEFIDMVCEISPDQVTLVPDPPDVLTSNEGWDTIKNSSHLSDVISELKKHNLRVSVFVNPNSSIIEGAKFCGADRIELYTEAYCQG